MPRAVKRLTTACSGRRCAPPLILSVMHINNKFTRTILGSILFCSISVSQTTYPENETGQFEDMLTPEYYLSEIGSPMRHEINRLVYFTRLEPFQHPLQDSNGEILPHIIRRSFGEGIGLNGTSQHHPASDFHPDIISSTITMFASHDGIVSTFTDAPKYRDYLTITKQMADSSGEIIGKLVTIYAHLDLELDSLDGFYLDGQNVNQGDTVSVNLYSETVGGPHLHYEIRLYRPLDSGNEEFYSFVGPQGSDIYTEPSAGSWVYGFWNPNVGYGFANPDNHIQEIATKLGDDFNTALRRFMLLQNFPNPFNSSTTIHYTLPKSQKVIIEVFDFRGVRVKTMVNTTQQMGDHSVSFSGDGLPSGVYLYCLKANNLAETRKMLLLK